MNQLVFYNSRKYAVLMLLVCLSFAIVCLFMISYHDNIKTILPGWLGLMLCGTGVFVFIRQIVDTRPRLVIDDSGVYDRTLSVGTISWKDIVDAYVQSSPYVRPSYGLFSRPSFICLRLSDDTKYTSKLLPILRPLLLGNVALGFTPLSLNMSGINVDPQTICELILGRSTIARSTDKSKS